MNVRNIPFNHSLPSFPISRCHLKKNQLSWLEALFNFFHPLPISILCFLRIALAFPVSLGFNCALLSLTVFSVIMLIFMYGLYLFLVLPCYSNPSLYEQFSFMYNFLHYIILSGISMILCNIIIFALFRTSSTFSFYPSISHSFRN